MTSTLFMIHGMWGGPFYWANFRSAFEPLGWRCMATTLPFHDTEPGARPNPRLGHTGLLDYAAALEREIEALDEPPILIGHSMGGLLAQMLCARGRARAAVLLAPASPAGIMAITPSVLKNFLPVMSRWGFWRKPMRPSSAADSMLHLLPPAERRSTRAQFVPESGRAAAEIGLWPFDRRGASRVDPTRVTCPLLVLAGAEDRITPPRTVRQVARRYGERARYREFERHGHWLPSRAGDRWQLAWPSGWRRFDKTGVRVDFFADSHFRRPPTAPHASEHENADLRLARIAPRIPVVSHCCHALGAPDPLITPHPAWARLGRTAEEGRRNYRELVIQVVDPEEIATIRRHLQHQRICGPDRLRLAIERQLGRKLGPKKIGRARKPSSKPTTSWKVDSDPGFQSLSGPRLSHRRSNALS